MATWFSVRVVYDATNEKGMSIKKKELYLIDAMSFTEAEARVIGEVTPYTDGELSVTAMKLENIAEIFNTEREDADIWYRIKVQFMTLDEKSGKEKKGAHVYLVKGASTEDATKNMHERMKGEMVDYTIHTVSETQYMDVFFYDLEKESDETR